MKTYIFEVKGYVVVEAPNVAQAYQAAKRDRMLGTPAVRISAGSMNSARIRHGKNVFCADYRRMVNTLGDATISIVRDPALLETLLNKEITSGV